MAADFIKIVRNNSNATHAQRMLNAVAQVRSALTVLEEIQGLGYRMFDAGPPVDFEVFEQTFGVPEGAGQTVFDLVNGTVLALKGEAQNANATELITRVG
jgi:hypothetical protein